MLSPVLSARDSKEMDVSTVKELLWWPKNSPRLCPSAWMSSPLGQGDHVLSARILVGEAILPNKNDHLYQAWGNSAKSQDTLKPAATCQLPYISATDKSVVRYASWVR